MKQKIVLSLLFICTLVATTKAQISKGAVWVGGSIGYSQSNSGVDTFTLKARSLNINPAIGMVVKDNLVVGISFLYSHNNTTNYALFQEGKTNTYGAGLFVRRYIPIVSRLYVFGEVEVNYQSSKINYGDKNIQGNPAYTTKGWSSGLSVTPGVSFAVSKKFLLETSFNNLLGVAYSKSKSYEQPIGNAGNQKINKSESFTAGILTDGKVVFNVGCRFLL